MCIKVKETNQWLVVKNDEFKFKPYKANPLCLVITNDNDEEYSLGLYLRQQSMCAYLMPINKGYFENRCDFSTLKTFNTEEFIKNTGFKYE